MSVTTLIVVGMIEVFIIAMAFLAAYRDKTDKELFAVIYKHLSENERKDLADTWVNAKR